MYFFIIPSHSSQVLRIIMYFFIIPSHSSQVLRILLDISLVANCIISTLFVLNSVHFLFVNVIFLLLFSRSEREPMLLTCIFVFIWTFSISIFFFLFFDFPFTSLKI
jgi:hypothetical protein